MAQIKHQYYSKGTAQKKSDITIDLTRPDIEVMRNWSKEQKEHLSEFLDQAKKSFQAFKKECRNCLKY